MYRLTHKIVAFDARSDSITRREFEIGLRYRKSDGEVYDHMIASPIDGVELKYVELVPDCLGNGK